MSSVEDTLPIRPAALRLRDIQRLALIIIVIALGTAVLYAFLAFSAQAWPVLGIAAICLGGSVLYAGVYIWAGRGQTKRAVRTMIGAFVVLLPACSLFVADLETLLALATPVLTFIIANIMFNWWRAVLWGILGVLGGIATLVIDRLPFPFERTAASEMPALQLIAVGVTLGAGVVIVWQALRLYQNIELIRVRLLTAFVAAALLPVLLIGATFGAVSFYAGQQIMIDQTQAIAKLKVDTMEVWLTYLRSSLVGALHPQEIETLVSPLAEAMPGSRD